jgi:hypothetical protein
MLLESLGLSPSNIYIYIEFDLDLFRFPPGVNLELNFLSSNLVMLIFHLILDRQARGMTKFGKASPQLLERHQTLTNSIPSLFQQEQQLLSSPKFSFLVFRDRFKLARRTALIYCFNCFPFDTLSHLYLNPSLASKISRDDAALPRIYSASCSNKCTSSGSCWHSHWELRRQMELTNSNKTMQLISRPSADI